MKERINLAIREHGDILASLTAMVAVLIGLSGCTTTYRAPTADEIKFHSFLLDHDNTLREAQKWNGETSSQK